jgi:uncharacterized membrane protein
MLRHFFFAPAASTRALVAAHALSSALAPHFSFPRGAANEEIALRWIHFVSGIIWIGLLYFFNLIGRPAFDQLEPSTRVKVFPILMSRAMWWFRWSAVVTVLVGLRYFTIILQSDAVNSGNPNLLWKWFGEWLATWIVAYVFLYPLQMPRKGAVNNVALRAILITILLITASWITLDLNSSPDSSNGHLCIAVGGGLGLIMLLNVWGVVWRVQKRLIQWSSQTAADGSPMPPDAAKLRNWGNFAGRVAFYISFPMLFFMGAAEHYPFLSGIFR